MNWTAILLSAAMLIAWSALCLALVAFRNARTALLRKRFPWQQLESLELQVSDLDERHKTLLASFKRLQSRVGMREARAAAKAGSDADDQLELPEPIAVNGDERLALQRMLAKMKGV